MNKPLVSVICLCYNHEKYISAAVESVLNQSYGNIELIVVDDASNDDSRLIIEKLSKTVGFRAIYNNNNLGNCTSFNNAFALANGKYIIDLAADDLLLPNRIEIGVSSLEKHGPVYGVHFCDVELTDENGLSIGTHYKRDTQGKLIENVPQGDVFAALLEKYYICTPSMMMSRKVLEELGGYDENLSYEDFDFWVRSSRNYKYAFSDKVLVRKRILPNSMSAGQRQKKNKHILSTAAVCEKALKLQRNDQEKIALITRINYELKWALITENWQAAELFADIKKRLGVKTLRTLTEKTIIKMKPSWYRFWNLFYAKNDKK